MTEETCDETFLWKYRNSVYIPAHSQSDLGLHTGVYGQMYC